MTLKSQHECRKEQHQRWIILLKVEKGQNAKATNWGEKSWSQQLVGERKYQILFTRWSIELIWYRKRRLLKTHGKNWCFNLHYVTGVSMSRSFGNCKLQILKEQNIYYTSSGLPPPWSPFRVCPWSPITRRNVFSCKPPGADWLSSISITFWNKISDQSFDLSKYRKKTMLN